MIPKVIPKRRSGRSSFHTLLAYMIRDDVNHKLDNIEEDLTAIERELVVLGQARGLDLLEHFNASAELSMPIQMTPSVETNCLSVHTASAEMKAVSDMNGRVKDPVYHCILSWRGGEHPSDEQMFEAGRDALVSVGMEGHQYVFVVHRDTDNHHLHMMVNRVNPETEKTVYPDRDFFRLDLCMRELELKQGWEHDNGVFAVLERDGIKVVDWSSTDRNTKEKRPSKARDMEEVSGQESLFSYARGEPRDAVIELFEDPTATWQELHQVLARHGLELLEKGKGLAVFDKENPGQTPVKASDVLDALGKGKLVKRLGEYAPPIRAIHVQQPESTYTKYREPQRDQDDRDPAREERAQARSRLRVQYDEWVLGQTWSIDKAAERNARQQMLADLAARHKVQREQIRASRLPGPTKMALHSVLAMDALQARKELKIKLVERRKVEQLKRPRGFRAWTYDRAQGGDQAAIGQVRGWANADRRSAKEIENSDRVRGTQDGITTDGLDKWIEPLSPRHLAVLSWLSYNVDARTGDVRYEAKNRHVFTDSGRRVTFSDDVSTDAKALVSGLLLARKKFGPQLRLTGSDQFKEVAISSIVEKCPDIRLIDSEQEARRIGLEAQRELNKKSRKAKSQRVIVSSRNASPMSPNG